MAHYFKHGWVRLLAAVAAGVLLALTTDLTPHWWGVWLAPIPLLAAVLRARTGEARRLTLLAGLIGILPLMGYVEEVLGAVPAIVNLLLFALLWAVIFMIARRAVLHARHAAVVFLFPALWAGFDTLVTAFSPNAAAGSFAPDQAGFRSVWQIGSIAGNAGIVFLVMLFGSLIVVAEYHRRNLRHATACYGAAVALLAVGLGWGAARAYEHPREPTVRIGMVAIDDADPHMLPGAAAQAAWAQYLDAVPGEVAAGAQIVVFPEKAAPVLPNEATPLAARLASTARDYNIYLLAGIDLHFPDHLENRAWLFDPDGGLLVDYSKQHPVPGLEREYRPGHVDATRTVAGAPMGVAICKDLDFPGLDRSYGRRHIALMLQPSWDFDVDEQWRADIANLAGVENGYSVVHASKNGLLQVSDRYGHVVTALASERAPVAALVTAAPLGPASPTLYARFGDWFGWLCVGALVGLLVFIGSRWFSSDASSRTSRDASPHAAAMR